VYHEIREHPGKDKIELSQYLAQDRGLNERTFRRGLRELLEKEFLYRSTSDGVFFINIRFMFNGDRLAFVKSYHLKGASRQHELPLGETRAIPVQGVSE
jgi:DNA-binding transcriptional regulator YhcF (GntR family)